MVAHTPLASRIAAALFGSYALAALAALASVAVLVLPMRASEALFTGTVNVGERDD